jgi:conjugative relaxase-like TrwC/TraI family protein
MIQSSSASHAKSYFSDALQKSDYYINDQELQGRFLGRLADRIGITGMADKETFFALCANVNPRTGGSLTAKTLSGRTVGYDINFHCPKSVSIVHSLSKDNHILDAFSASVKSVMDDIEADSMTRVRKKGAYEDRYTGELLWADFVHQTARPVDGSAPDPHLHAHCFVFNATWDDKEKQLKAGQFKDIKRDMPYYQARFHKILSDKLTDLGYQIRRTAKSFEIEGVPKSAIDLFSKRTNEIGEFAKEHGITDQKQLSELGARTRSKKQKGLSMTELKEIWREQIQENIVYDENEANQQIRFAPVKVPSPDKAKDCVDHALQHTFERASVMGDRRILATAYRQSIGKRLIQLDEITTEFKNHDDLIHIRENNRNVCTTKIVLAEERHMVALARKGQSKFTPLYATVPYIKLDGQQGAAIRHILTTKHQVSIIRGGAGTGKTKLLTVLDEMISRTGKEIIMVAPTAQASRGVLANEGFKDAETVAKLLVDKELQAKLSGQILCCDEAGLLGTKDMTSLLELADKHNARLILVGDTRQHSAVIRGDALRILNTVGNISTAEVTLIRRQKNVEYRQAVEYLAKGNIRDGFTKLDDMGAIKSVDPLKPNEVLIEDYIKTVKKGKSALIVSPTNKQAESVSADLRVKLRSNQLLGKKEISAVRLTNLNLTEAEKADWRNFSKGQIIQFNQNVKNIKRGSSWSVEEASEKHVEISNTEGKVAVVPRDIPAAYDVCQRSSIALSGGDQVRITRNRFDKEKKRLDNGQYLEVLSINKAGEIALINRKSKATYKLDKDFGYLDYSYCTTSHSSQGKSVDEVFISQPASTFAATDAKQFYVSVSRGKHAVTIYTDDKEALLEYASEIGDRQSALELVGKNKLHSDYVLQQQKDAYENHGPKKPIINKEIIKPNRDIEYEPGL